MVIIIKYNLHVGALVTLNAHVIAIFPTRYNINLIYKVYMKWDRDWKCFLLYKIESPSLLPHKSSPLIPHTSAPLAPHAPKQVWSPSH